MSERPITIHRTSPVLDEDGEETYDDYGYPVMQNVDVVSTANRIAPQRSYEPVNNTLTLVTTFRASLPPTAANLALANEDTFTAEGVTYEVTGILRVGRAIGPGIEHLLVDLRVVGDG